MKPITAAISVIIPTLRRHGKLHACLRSLQDQSHPNFEIVVVDNASDPSVESMVSAFNQAARVPARYLSEPQLGLHNARHHGVKQAKSNLLVFTDDDATFDPSWLEAYAVAFDEHQEMAAAGGPIRLIWEVAPPNWLLEFIGDAKQFGILGLNEPYDEFRLGSECGFWGANMAIRREILLKLGGFNPDLFGDIYLGDGESGLERKVIKAGLLIGYVPGALAFHHIPPERMTVRYFRHRMANEGAAEMYARYHKATPTRIHLLTDILKTTFRNAAIWPLAGVLRGRTERRALKVQLRAARTLSHVRYLFRLMHDSRLRSLVAKENWLEASQ